MYVRIRIVYNVYIYMYGSCCMYDCIPKHCFQLRPSFDVICYIVCRLQQPSWYCPWNLNTADFPCCHNSLLCFYPSGCQMCTQTEQQHDFRILLSHYRLCTGSNQNLFQYGIWQAQEASCICSTVH